MFLYRYLRRGNRQIIDRDNIQRPIELPVTRWSQHDEENARNRDQGYIISGEFFVARLVMYDYLGIRYEQADQFHVSDIPPNTLEVMGGSFGFSPDGSINRFIEYGEYGWGRIHIVRQ